MDEQNQPLEEAEESEKVYSDEEMMERAQPMMGPGYNHRKHHEEWPDSEDEEEELTVRSRFAIDNISGLN